MIRIIAKGFVITVAVTAFLHVVPLSAASVTWVSSTGSGNSCTAALPCGDLITAALALTNFTGQINCINAPETNATGISLSTPSISLTIDCAGVYEAALPNFGAFKLSGANQIVKLRNLTISGTGGGYPGITVTGSGTLIIENCVFENMPGITLDIEPNGLFNLVIKNSRISNGSTVAIVLKPSSQGTINATFDHVTVTQNGGGGIRLDATNGPVSVDITDSVITNNMGNGLNASGGAGPAILSIHNSVIAKNGAAGVSASGTGAALIDATLLDSNASATSVASGGRILTYGNNRIIGPAGTGFTGSVALQ